MSWRRPTGHLDANVPDYQKMLQGRYPSSGWSSTQPALSSYSSRFPGASNHSSGYLSQRPSTSSYGHTSPRSGFSNTYQPSKYGSDSSYSSSIGVDQLRGLQGDHSNGNRTDNGYEDRSGFSSRPYEPESFRTLSNRGSGYTSDSGHGVVSRAATDYSSDSGMSYRRQSWKSSDFELDIPSPNVSGSHNRSQNDDELFHSPVKSKETFDFNTFNGSHNAGIENHLSDYRHISKSTPNLDKYQNIVGLRYGHSTDEEETSPRQASEGYGDEDNNKKDESNGDDESFRSNFKSPKVYNGDLNDLPVAHRPPISQLRGNKSDLTHWQQNQKSPVTNEYEHRTLHLKSTTHSPRTEIPLRDYSSDVESSRRNDTHSHQHNITSSRHKSHGITPLHNNHDTNHVTSSTYDQHPASEQMKSIRSAADAIIRDKDAIIYQLKDRLESSEETSKEYENKIRRLMNRGPSSEESVSFSKMRNLEFRNSELQAELSSLKAQKNTEIDELEIKLGGVEHENQQLKTALRKAQPNVAEMKEKLLAKEEEIKSWKKKCSDLSGRYESVNEKLEGMGRYLEDLPTLEEFTKNAEDLAASNEDNELKKAQIADLEERLNDTTQQLSERESTVQELEVKQEQLAMKMKDLTLEIRRVRTEGEGKILTETQEELTETKETRDRYLQDLQKAKKLLEGTHRRHRQLEAKHQSDIRHLQERLQQEEESVVALREEAAMKEKQIAKLKKSLKEFAGKNQDLMDEGLVLKEQLKQYEQTSLDESQKMQRQFVQQMSLCFTELQTLVQICVQQAEGKDPNISLLLGSTATLGDEDGAVGGMSGDMQSLKHWLKKVKELRGEVEKIHGMMCNKFANDMGDNLTCATQ